MSVSSFLCFTTVVSFTFCSLITTTKAAYTFAPERKNYNAMRVTSLHRYAVKGLSDDAIKSVQFKAGDGTFPDDRRFALLYESSDNEFDPEDPDWLHKGNFLCAFTAPELLATLDTEYRIAAAAEGDQNVNDEQNSCKRLLTVWRRESKRSSPPLLGPVDLATQAGRHLTGQFFSELCGRKVSCVFANTNGNVKKQLDQQHGHQFGNTSAGIKNNDGDTRTVHIINSNTVREFSDTVFGAESGEFLSSTMFRPNIIVDGLEPWAEFDLIGKTIEVVPSDHEEFGTKEEQGSSSPLRFQIVSRTVRCAGVGVDPLRPDLEVIDIPGLLAKKFPKHGPYLGVYAIIEKGCTDRTLFVGDRFRVVPTE